MASSASYRAVLRTPGVVRTFVAALTGRLSYGLVFVVLAVALTRVTSVQAAGGCLAVFAATTAALAPLRAALIDRYGVRRALTPLVAGYAACLTGLAVATSGTGGGVPVLAVLCALAGTHAPPLGPTMRAVWGRLFADEQLRRRAFSLDTVAEELLLVVGPLLAGLFIAVEVPSWGVAASAVLVFGGTVAFVTSPLVVDGVHATRVKGGGRRRDLAGVLPPAVTCAGAGFALGALNLLVVAFATARGQPVAVAWTEAALATGSALGGLAYGAVAWRRPTATRLGAAGGALGALLGLAALAPGLATLAAVVFATGLFVAPTLTSAYLLADERVPAAYRTQAGTWVNTAFNAGSTVGTALGGVLVTALPRPASFALVGAVMVLAAGVGARDTFVGWSRGRTAARTSSS